MPLMESKILATAWHSRDDFELLDTLEVKEDLSDCGQIIFKAIQDYYLEDAGAQSVDTELLEETLGREYPTQRVLFESILEKIGEETSAPNLIKLVTELKKDKLGRMLSTELLSSRKKNAPKLMEDYLNMDSNIELLLGGSDAEGEDTFNGVGIEGLLRDSGKTEFRLWPKSLQQKTGGADRCNTMLIYARPEIGKSLFFINLACGMAYDGHKILIIENEDPVKMTLKRIVSRLASLPIKDALADVESTDKIIRERGYENITLKSCSPGTFKEFRSLIKKHEPDVLIINQLRNIKDGKLSVVEQLAHNATEMRNLAKESNIFCIGITQAGESAANKLVLSMEDIDSSKTGMIAQIDLAVGIGANLEFLDNNRRMISLPKNKLSGCHEYFPIGVDILTSKVIDI
jgi:archaellum biogenesis ATPase FlaH